MKGGVFMDESAGAPAAKELFVTSRDGAVIHCRRSGDEPGLVLLQGGLRSAASLTKLARDLSAHFTVVAVDRRGRRPSAPAGGDYSLQKEVDDLNAVLAQRGAAHVFGQRSGALIALKAALDGAPVQKIALLSRRWSSLACTRLQWILCRPMKRPWRPDLARALVVIFKGADDPSWFMSLPGFVVAPLFRRLLAGEKAGGDAPSLVELNTRRRPWRGLFALARPPPLAGRFGCGGVVGTRLSASHLKRKQQCLRSLPAFSVHSPRFPIIVGGLAAIDLQTLSPVSSPASRFPRWRGVLRDMTDELTGEFPADQIFVRLARQPKLCEYA
jgi:hypothetical protein